MKILVYPSNLDIGGSQIAALVLAGAVRDRGHEVVVVSAPGLLAASVRDRGLRLVTPSPERGGSASRAARLLRLARAERVDVVHAYGMMRAMESFAGPLVLGDFTVVVTEYGRRVVPLLPRSLPLVVGLEQLGPLYRARQSAPVLVLRVPIENGVPTSVEVTTFVAAHRLDDGVPNIIMTSRIGPDETQRHVEQAIAGVAALGEERPVRLVIAGDGPGRADVEVSARAVNERLGYRAVLAVGNLIDARPAYAVADVVVGLATSLARGIAQGKPAIALGPGGRSEIVEPGSLDRLERDGFVAGPDAPADALASQLRSLLDDPTRARSCGASARHMIAARRDPAAAAAALESFYIDALEQRPSRVRMAGDALRYAAGALRYRTRRLAARATRPSAGQRVQGGP